MYLNYTTENVPSPISCDTSAVKELKLRDIIYYILCKFHLYITENLVFIENLLFVKKNNLKLGTG
jgi:hypothetical protein